MYAGPVIDPRHHLWDLSLGKHSWLSPAGPSVQDQADAVPDLPIIINHCGSPVDRGPAGMQQWRDALKTLSALPDLVTKMSNPGACDPAYAEGAAKAVARARQPANSDPVSAPQKPTPAVAEAAEQRPFGAGSRRPLILA